jgi:type II secretory pathway predicted ATPase ExeA
MYESFFNLHGSPFPAIPIVANYFPSRCIESARQSLIRVVERAEGPGLIVGPAGVGKSLLLRVLAEHFREVFQVVLLSGARVATRKSLLQSVLFELGLNYRGLDEGELRLALIDALRPGDECPNGILLLIDEAHTLPLRLLDELRMITNVVRDGQPRARLVLAGGPQLEVRFANPKVESFSQRLAARCYLNPFTRDETYEFVRAQLSGVGGDPDAILTEDAGRAVFHASDGIPRLVNQICDHALLLAHSKGIPCLDAALVQEAWSDLQQLPPPWQDAHMQYSSELNTVIEFGELDHDELSSKESGDDGSRSDSAPATSLAASPQRNSPASTGDAIGDGSDPLALLAASADPVQAISFGHCANVSGSDDPTLVIGFPPVEHVVEWFEGGAAEAEWQPTNLAHNPFEAPFEEEVVVIDHSEASEIEAFRGRTRVNCLEGREIRAGLKAALRSCGVPLDEDCQADASAWEPSQPAPLVACAPAGFEFTTLDADALDLLTNEPLPSTGKLVTDALDRLEHDLDEEIDSVPLPWTRGVLGDDRDVIIIDEDGPSVSVFPDDNHDEHPRRIEYRELFAQLRRASN